MVVISLLRGINVGGNHTIRMDILRSIYEEAGCEDPRTLLQSGNVVYRTDFDDLDGIARRVEAAVEQQHGFRPAVVQRTADEMRRVAAANPFEEFARAAPSKMAVLFLAGEPATGAESALQSGYSGPETFRLVGRELFVCFPEGLGRSKLTSTVMERAFRVSMTGRNWNTVLRLVGLAATLEGAAERPLGRNLRIR